MATFRISWSTEAWHYQDVEAEGYTEAEEAWNPDGARITYQEDVTDKWFEVECIEADESQCPEDDRGSDA
jgi:hypothetical protein